MRVLIPSFRAVETGSSGGMSHKFVVYIIHVIDGHTEVRLERRYSDFHQLHRQLKRLYRNLNLPEFPPKKIRNLSQKVIEQRRVALQVYLQSAVDSLCNDLPLCLSEFLDMDKARLTQLNLLSGDDEEVDSCKLEHQPVLSFIEDPFKDSESPSLPNNVVEATLDALYNPSYP